MYLLSVGASEVLWGMDLHCSQLSLSICPGYAQCADQGMMPSDHFHSLREIAKVAVLHGYILEAVLYSETTLYIAQETSLITRDTNSTPMAILARGES